jgi:hypothetical protein
VTVVPCKLEKNHRATIKRTEGEIGTNILVLVNKKVAGVMWGVTFYLSRG